MGERLVTIERTGPVATVTIRRPDKLNALSAEVIAELAAAVAELGRGFEGEDPARVAVLTGEGKAFVAGADIAAMQAMTPLEARRFSEAGHALCAAIEESPVVFIAAVNGFALGGGCELALACDFAYAAEGAKFGQPEVNLGIIPGFGGTQRLARRVGVARARELLYTGDFVDAEAARAMGLVNAVHPAEALLPRSLETAQRIASRGPLAVAAAKRLVLRGEGQGLRAACELETQAFAALFGSEDQRGGMKAFVEKAKPDFRGR